MIIVSLLFFGLMLLGLPIGYVLGVAGVAGLVQVGGENFLTMGPKRFFEGLDLFTFMAMPFFILAGEIMNRTGITNRIVDFTNSLVGYLRGGLAHSNMVASVLFAGMTGAAVSDTAAFGNTLVPAMVRQGYTRPFSCAVTVAGSIIGPTIPPSNLMVIYGSLMGVSIAGLFAAGILAWSISLQWGSVKTCPRAGRGSARRGSGPALSPASWPCSCPPSSWEGS